MRFHTAFTLATLAASSSASPLVRRQGGGSGIPANATEVNDKHGTITYHVGKKWNKSNEPYPGAAQLINPATKNCTNTTLAALYTPAADHPQSNFDFRSLDLGMNQELIELDLFHNGLAKLSFAEFEAAGITADDRFLIEHMAAQEVRHAILISNMLGADRSAKTCVYQYPYTAVKEFILFCQVLARWGEAGVYGFLHHLKSRSAAQMLLQSITVEVRQQMAFRLLQGLPAQPGGFETGLSQSYAWAMLSRFSESCPSPWALGGKPANYTLISGAGRELHFTWEQPCKVTGYDDRYVSSTFTDEPKVLPTYAPTYDTKKGHDGLSSASARLRLSLTCDTK
ncbi:hypothetical protein JCM1841_005394 [Sporobolomyces salmonicolor]